jgi:site-specific DNA-methyltransferase (adenine-specific)
VYEGVAEGYQRPNKSSYTHKTDWHMQPQGRWPANVIHDGSDEVVSLFPQTSSGELRPYSENHQNATSFQMHRDKTFIQDANSGSSARFFYTAKASREERSRGMHDTEEQITDDGRNIPIDNPYLRGKTLRSNTHPTVKPLDLMAYLCKLLCPPSGGVLLDPFMGSGTTIIAGRRFYQHCIGIELEEKYAEIAAKRLSQEVLDFGGTE